MLSVAGCLCSSPQLVYWVRCSQVYSSSACLYPPSAHWWRPRKMSCKSSSTTAVSMLNNYAMDNNNNKSRPQSQTQPSKQTNQNQHPYRIVQGQTKLALRTHGKKWMWTPVGVRSGFRKGSAFPAPHVAPVTIQLRTKIRYYYQTNTVACVKRKCYIYQQGQNDGHIISWMQF